MTERSHVSVARVHRTEVVRASPGGAESVSDELVIEEPLEIRIAKDPIAVTMRTPGHDRELVLGFLWSEGIITSLNDVGSIAHCGRLGDAAKGNTIEVVPGAGSRLRLPDEGFGRRGTVITSACGVCGRQSIDDLLARCRPVTSTSRLTLGALFRSIEELGRAQTIFARTGGCHGALLATLSGDKIAAFEDVGRHNAVDKLIGARLLARAIPASDQLLVVSGRTSFDIVQKAVTAGIPFVAGISAGSSLAVEMARRAGVTLIGFARGGRCTVYSGAERFTS